jgi:hypothetical protein
MKDIKTTIISTLKEFEQQDYKRGGVSIAPEMYGAIADKLCSRFTIGNLDLVHEPNECCGRCDGVNDFCINEESTMMELKSLHEPNQATMIAAKCTCGRHTYCDSSESLCVNNIFTDNSNQTTMEYTEQPFNLETALKHPEWVRTRDGREIDFIKEYPERTLYTLAVVLKDGNALSYFNNGSFYLLPQSPNDLILRVPYVTKWFNVYKNTGYLSKEEADSSATLEHRIACVPVKIPANI